MTLIANLVATITASPAPVLFLDSCILLDIVRAPRRNKPDEVRVAQLFRTSVNKAPKTVRMRVPQRQSINCRAIAKLRDLMWEALS